MPIYVDTREARTISVATVTGSGYGFPEAGHVVFRTPAPANTDLQGAIRIQGMTPGAYLMLNLLNVVPGVTAGIVSLLTPIPAKPDSNGWVLTNVRNLNRDNVGMAAHEAQVGLGPVNAQVTITGIIIGDPASVQAGILPIPAPIPPAPRPGPKPKEAGKTPWGWIVGGALGLAVLGGIAVAIKRRRR